MICPIYDVCALRTLSEFPFCSCDYKKCTIMQLSEQLAPRILDFAHSIIDHTENTNVSTDDDHGEV